VEDVDEESSNAHDLIDHEAGYQKLLDALAQIQEIDRILEQLGVFWANTEVGLLLESKLGQ
jgi:hypothetical protein